MKRKLTPHSVAQANQQGFTLIELVVVIVILGILAVTAAPKFINLQSDAHTATLQAIKASMETASSLVHSKSLIAGNENAAVATDPTVIVDSAGNAVNLNFGYPISTAATGKVPVTDWGLLLDVNSSDFIITTLDNKVIVYPADKRVPTAIPTDPEAPAAATSSSSEDCFAYYDEAASATVKPVMIVAVCL